MQKVSDVRLLEFFALERDANAARRILERKLSGVGNLQECSLVDLVNLLSAEIDRMHRRENSGVIVNPMFRWDDE